jgi:tetratricopeptide (TPR) repeat protein
MKRPHPLHHCLVILTFGLTLMVGTLQAETNLSKRFRRQYHQNLADTYYQTREIPGHLQKAIDNYRRVLRFDDHQPDIHWRITRCFWVLATKRATNQEERLHFFNEGIRHGAQALDTDAENANTYVWNALIHGNHALEQGVMNALYMRNRLKTWLERALTLDETNVNALLGLAGWYFYVPEFFGGDKTVTYQLIDQAEKLDPHYTAILLQKAQFQITEGKLKEAAATLRRILQQSQPTLPNDAREDKAAAAALLEQLKNEHGIS